jgi:hypothetical protein
MEETSDWRSANYAKAFDGHDRADFAQEFLRRNPEYRDQYAGSLNAASMARKRFAAHWGLAFRGRP